MSKLNRRFRTNKKFIKMIFGDFIPDESMQKIKNTVAYSLMQDYAKAHHVPVELPECLAYALGEMTDELGIKDLRKALDFRNV